MSTINLEFRNISLPLDFTAAEMEQFKYNLLELLSSSIDSSFLFTSLTILVYLSNSKSFSNFNMSMSSSSILSSIAYDAAMGDFIVNTFADRLCKKINSHTYVLNIKSQEGQNLLDDDFVNRLALLNLSSSSEHSSQDNRNFTITIKKDTSLATLFDSIVNNAKDYLPMKTIKDALTSSLNKTFPTEQPNLELENTSRIERSRSASNVNDSKDPAKNAFSNMSVTDMLSTMARGCSNTCNVSCPKCEYVLVTNSTPKDSVSLNYSDSVCSYSLLKHVNVKTLTVHADSKIFDVNLSKLEGANFNLTHAFLNFLMTLEPRRTGSDTLETSTYVKRHYKRSVPTDASNTTSVDVVPSFLDIFSKVEIPAPKKSNITPGFIDALDKKFIDPVVINRSVIPRRNVGIIDVKPEVLKKIYASNGSLIMDFSNITLDIIREGHTYKFTTTNGSYDNAESFMKYIVDLYGVKETMALLMSKFVGMPEDDFIMFLDLLIHNTNMMKRMMRNNLYRETMTPVFLQAFFSINKQDLKPLLSQMVTLFNSYDDKGFFVNNFIPLITYYEYSSNKDGLKAKLKCGNC